MQLQDVRAIVTGAGSGLGQHFAVQLARAGASVAADLEFEAGCLAGSFRNGVRERGLESVQLDQRCH